MHFRGFTSVEKRIFSNKLTNIRCIQHSNYSKWKICLIYLAITYFTKFVSSECRKENIIWNKMKIFAKYFYNSTKLKKKNVKCFNSITTLQWNLIGVASISRKKKSWKYLSIHTAHCSHEFWKCLDSILCKHRHWPRLD